MTSCFYAFLGQSQCWRTNKKASCLLSVHWVPCRSRIELVQDLEFPAACHRLKLTPDGEYLFATGIHAPRVRVYELGQLSLKFERHFDAEVVDFQARCPPCMALQITVPAVTRRIQDALGSPVHGRHPCVTLSSTLGCMHALEMQDLSAWSTMMRGSEPRRRPGMGTFSLLPVVVALVACKPILGP